MIVTEMSGAGRHRLVAPAALGVLAADDQVDGFLQDRLDLVVAGLPPQLGESERRHRVGSTCCRPRAPTR